MSALAAKRDSSGDPKESPSAKRQTTASAASRGVASVPVPITALPSQAPSSGGAAPLNPKIDLDKGSTDVVSNMRLIIPYVKYHPKQKLQSVPELARQFPDTALHTHQPLDILAVGGLKDDQLKSFKHPWSSPKAKASLQGNGIYEAAGNIIWCDPLPPPSGHERTIAGDTGTWQEILDVADNDFDSALIGQRIGSVTNTPFR